MTLLEAIFRRVSTRSFDGAALGPDDARMLREMLDRTMGSIEPPFRNAVRLALAAGNGNGDGKPEGMGTMGLISGASAYLAAAAARAPGALEDIGYLMEDAVLEATRLGYDSCWIGGVFSRDKAARAAEAGRGDLVPCVVAIGKAGSKRSAADILVTGAARSRSRKPLESIVYRIPEGNLGEPWTTVARAVQAAPSASNKQPWRLVRAGTPGVWVVFLDEDRLYNSALGTVRLQNIDIGIAMRHFSAAAGELGLPGAWKPVAVPGSGRGGLIEALDFGRERGWKPVAMWE